VSLTYVCASTAAPAPTSTRSHSSTFDERTTALPWFASRVVTLLMNPKKPLIS